MARDESPLTFAGRTIGIGVCAPALLAPAVRDGGLAPVAVAALVAALVGVPAAQAEWRSTAPDQPGLRAAMSATAQLAGLLLVSAAVAPVVRSAGVAGFALAAIGWGLAVAAADRPRVVWWLAAGLVVAAVVRAVGSVATTSVGTLLTPQWGAWELWLGPALAGGLVAAGVGTGQWTFGPRRVPGHDETPWAVAGAAVVLATAFALQAGARFEGSLGVTTEDAGRAVLVALAGWLGAAVVVGRPDGGDRSARPVRAAFGTLATWWLAGPAAGGVALVLHAVVPASAALLLLGVVWSTRRSSTLSRSVIALSAALGCALVAVATSAPALPDELGTGVAAGLLLAAAFWVVATRVALAVREAPVIVFATAAWAAVEFETPPALGEETVIVVRDDLGDPRGGETVRVVHRPGLSGEQELAIGITDGRGRVRWTPRAEGVAWVRAGDEIARLQVGGSDGPPVIPFLVALLLFGGAGAFAYGIAGGRR